MVSMSTNVSTKTFVVNPSHTNEAKTCVFARDILGGVDTVADRLRWVIAQAGGSARALSIKAGKSPNAVQKILERGGSANGDTIAALARAAGVSEAWLLTGKGSVEDGVVPPGSQPPAPLDPPTSPIVAAPPTPSGESPLERALGAAFDHTRHTVGDLRAVQDALNDGSFQWQRVEGDLVESARTWLDAASALRREGQHVSTVSILYRVTAGKAARTRALAAQREATADAEGRRAMDEAGLTELGDAALEATQGTARRVGGRTATTTPFAPDESGPSGIRVVSPGGSPAVPKTAKG